MLEEVATQVRHLINLCKEDVCFKACMDARDEVIRRYQPIFSATSIPRLTQQEFREFLQFENNRHWQGITWWGARISQDMGSLRNALLNLHDTSRSIEDRWDTAIKVKGLKKATLSPILQIIDPDNFGVWNKVSQYSLQQFDMWPKFPSIMSEGQRYTQVNDRIKALAEKVEVSLWSLDLAFRMKFELENPKPKSE